MQQPLFTQVNAFLPLQKDQKNCRGKIKVFFEGKLKLKLVELFLALCKV